MAIDKLTKTLMGFGLTRTEVKTYVFLSKKGPSRAKDIFSEMRISKQQLYPCLKNLQRKGFIYSRQEHPAIFYASPLENVIDIFTAQRISEAQNAQKHKNVI